MPNKSYKTDESFLSKLAIGAVGTQRVLQHLQSCGHSPIELERGSTGYKVWKNIKIKRFRVPDLMCLDCGRRVESRGKTNLEISMSHSLSDPERDWQYGLDNGDYVAFVTVESAGERPIDYQAHQLVQYVSVKDMLDSYQQNRVIVSQAKGSQEGFEQRINWPITPVKSPGTITEIDDNTVKYKKDENQRTISYKRTRNAQGHTVKLDPCVNEGDRVIANQIIASVVPVKQSFPCKRDVTSAYYIDLLKNTSAVKRYVAVKALSLSNPDEAKNAFVERLQDNDEHIYIKLEAAAGLMRLADERGLEFLQNQLHDSYLEHRLETVIVLGEIEQEQATSLLRRTLTDASQYYEIRAGAAWALGELQDRHALDLLVDSFGEVDEEIRIEAARALAKLSRVAGQDVAEKITGTQADKRPGIAWALSQAGISDVDVLMKTLVDTDARQWAAYIIGLQDESRFAGQLEVLKEQDPEVYFAATVLWKIMSSWIYGLEEY